MKNVIITTGDHDGIGAEITFKAFKKIKPKKKIIFIIFINSRNHTLKNYYLDSFNIHTFKTLKQYLKSKVTFTFKDLIIIKSSSPPTEWVAQSTQAGINKQISALVTGPLSKTESYNSHGFKGHTDLFRKYIKTPIYMSFIGKYFNVLLLTDHMPLRSVAKSISKKLLLGALRASLPLAQLEPTKEVAVIGLNPHAGENQLLGKEEELIFTPTINSFNKKSVLKFSQPLVPDVAFFKSNWKKYSLFISPYHDQGLTAFKMIHEHSNGIQLTLGLPFIRTSVDHGTAKNIYGKNIADERSMLMAIKYAVKLTLTSQIP